MYGGVDSVQAIGINPVEKMETVNPLNITSEEVGEDQISRENAIWFWLGLGILYVVWDYFVLKQKTLADVIQPSNIRTNLYNIFFIGFAAIIFINGFKVLLVKMASFNIPILSKLSSRLLPLFQLK